MVDGMTHFFSEESIDANQRAKIEELKKALGKELLEETPLFDDDFSLLRWLLGWNYNIDEIVPRFKKASSVIKCLHLEAFAELNLDDIDEINELVSNLSPAAKYFPGGLMGQDREGNIIVCQAIAAVRPKDLVKCGKVTDLYKMALIECALSYKIVKINEEKYKRKLGSKMIFDMDGWSMDLLYTPTLKMYLNLIRLLQDVFPDFARSLIVINSPMMMSTVYQMIKPALSEQTRDKVRFVGKDYKATLIEDLGEENIYEKWGGTIKPKNGCTTGTLRMGGVPPEDIRYTEIKNPFHPDEKHLKKVSVSARNKTEVSLKVEKPGCILRWFFVSNGEVDFSIVCRGKEVWPKMRISTEYVPEYGHVICEEIDEYTLVFDNSFGTFFSKEVKFHAHIS
uniref:CRAL-TRIO domain-containing protein n=1 Tax=Acrobeloides nanus TaxID=290746 RepID=A0A914DU11_9BILA